MTTPRHGITEVPSGQNVSDTYHNEALRQLEQGANRFVVKDKDLTGPPGSPADGDAYIVAATATGAWTTHENKVAFYLSSAWSFITPKEGDRAEPIDEDLDYRYTGSAWELLEATAAEIRTGTATRKYISPAKMFASAAAASLTSGTTITPDGNNGWNFELTLAHNATLANPSNFKDGQSGLIKVIQDATGSRTLAYGSNWKFPGGAPVLSTAANTIDLIAYHVWPGGTITATLTKAYQS